MSTEDSMRRIGEAMANARAQTELEVEKIEQQAKREVEPVTAGDVRRPLPVPEPRGDEHLCAMCAERTGTVEDGEGRLICEICDDDRAQGRAA